MSYKAKGLALVAGALLIGASLATSASAATLRRGSTGSSGGTVAAGGPGQVLWTWFETSESSTFDHHAGNGDNIIRLVNPVGSANPEQGPIVNACAMIYVFDDDEELVECCGCPITPAQMATISVEDDLTDNPGTQAPNGEGGPLGDLDSGAIAIIATSLNSVNPITGGCLQGASNACNGNCDPSDFNNGVSISDANNLLGSITHNQTITGSGATGFTTTSGLTEVALFDDAGGDPTNINYLQHACGGLVGGASGGAICSCPEE